ncbi:MAG TPA: hypothetical protein VFO76_01935 [Candidatus Kapabacteria bacterium]|nr:hypothetical protein [Candidatus Kapabacteria bacterium]
MALLKKSYASFGREDKLSGVRAIVKGDNFFIRLIAYVLLAGLFLLIVEVTHKTPKPAEQETPVPEAKPLKK